MLFDGGFDTLFILVKIVVVDLLLSGDNAVVIALACRGLPPHHARQALFLGTGAAILLRLVLTALLSVFLYIPVLKLVGAVALLAIAVELSVADGDDDADGGGDPAQRLWAAVGMIVVADATMSLDNVMALAAVARGSLWLLLLGLCLSIPMLIFGSLAVSALMRRYPALVLGGGALLGWVAGDLAVSDPLIAGWVDREAFLLVYATPLAGAVFVWVKSRMIVAERARSPRRRPPPTPKSRPIQRPAPPPRPPVAASVPLAAAPPTAAMAAPPTEAVRAPGGTDRTALFRTVIIVTVVVIFGYVVNALGNAFAIIGQTVRHSRPTSEASCPDRVLAANRGVDPATLNRLVDQCRAQERAKQ